MLIHLYICAKLGLRLFNPYGNKSRSMIFKISTQTKCTKTFLFYPWHYS